MCMSAVLIMCMYVFMYLYRNNDYVESFLLPFIVFVRELNYDKEYDTFVL